MSLFQTIDLSDVASMLRRAAALADQLHGDAVPLAGKQATSAQRAEISRNLLLLQHMCQKAGVMAMDEYFIAKDFDIHMVGGGA